jgi:exonuclease VII small subunit
VEREAYKVAVHRAIYSLEEARVALETAIQRIEEGAAQSRSAGA